MNPDKCGHVCFCPLRGVIDAISKKWALLIVNSLGNYGSLRFTELEKVLNGISPKTLSDTLKDLQDLELVNREAFAEIPPRVEYSLTTDGQEFRESIIPLIKWAANRNGWDHGKCPSGCHEPRSHIINPDTTEKNLRPIIPV